MVYPLSKYTLTTDLDYNIQGFFLTSPLRLSTVMFSSLYYTFTLFAQAMQGLVCTKLSYLPSLLKRCRVFLPSKA